METPGLFEEWHARVDQFLSGLQTGFDEDGFPARIQWLGCTFGIYVGATEPIREYRDFSKLNPTLAKAFFCKCIEKGVYFHTDFTVSQRHDPATLEKATDLIRQAAREAKAEIL